MSDNRISMDASLANLPDGIKWLYPGDVSRSKVPDTESGYLFVRGDSAPLLTDRPRIGIVGSRAATEYGQRVASELAYEAASRGWTVVSGGAYGIDAAAHRAALAGGSTVAVLAVGVDRYYPGAHRALLDAIAARPGSCVVSGVAPGTTPTRERFLNRNGTIVGMCDALVIVEASIRSGSMNAALHADALKVPMFAVPGPVTSVQSSGTHALIKDGRADLLTDITDLVEAVPA